MPQSTCISHFFSSPVLLWRRPVPRKRAGKQALLKRAKVTVLAVPVLTKNTRRRARNTKIRRRKKAKGRTEIAVIQRMKTGTASTGKTCFDDLELLQAYLTNKAHLF